MFSFDKKLQNPASLGALALQLQKIFADLADSLNSANTVQPDLDGKGYPGQKPGDLLVTQTSGNITLGLVVSDNTRVSVTLGPAITDLNSNYLGTTTTTALPTTTEYPINGNWGFHFNSATSKIYITYNLSGVIKKLELV